MGTKIPTNTTKNPHNGLNIYWVALSPEKSAILPHICTQEPYIPITEPYIFETEPYISIKEPYIPVRVGCCIVGYCRILTDTCAEIERYIASIYDIRSYIQYPILTGIYGYGIVRYCRILTLAIKSPFTKESDIAWISTKEPCISIKGPCISIKEPYIHKRALRSQHSRICRSL